VVPSIESVPLTVKFAVVIVFAPVPLTVTLLNTIAAPVTDCVAPFNITVSPVPVVNMPPVLFRFPPMVRVVTAVAASVNVPLFVQFPPTVNEFGPSTVSEVPVWICMLLHTAGAAVGSVLSIIG